jgi:hypothetical protein
VSDEDRKDATTTIASEAIRVLPEADKVMAGRKAGDAITNLAAAAADVTLWIRLVASVPRGVAAFVARAAQKWRALPAERRALPSPKLLLEAAAGYAAVDDEELKTRYERLLESALDVETAPRVHPAFPTMLGEMTGIEARLLELFAEGGYFESFEAVIAALNSPIDRRQLLVGLQNLDRLGLVSHVETMTTFPNTAGARHNIAQAMGAVHVEERVPHRPDVNPGDKALLYQDHRALTSLGVDFLAAVGKRDP